MADLSARSILSGTASGPIIAAGEALSFWGGVDPATGRVIDVHHPLHGTVITGGILMMPSSRGSCTGSGVLLDLEAGFVQKRARVCKFEGRASVDGATTCEVQFTAMIADG